MKILVENGCYHLRNMGDVAMLQVAVARLSDLWPDAMIQVITAEPGLLVKYLPKAHPIAVQGRDIWFKDRRIFGGFSRWVPEAITNCLLKLWRQIRKHWPWLAYTLIRLNAKYRGVDVGEMDCFLEAVLGANVVTVSGGGDINDAFAGYAMTLLDVLAMAIRRGTPTAMFGQGVGPIGNSKLEARGKEVLPQVELIAIRESYASPFLLESLGVRKQRIFVTGDDAIELAYELRAARLGNGIGVNLRVAEYSETNTKHIDMVRAVLQDAARGYSAPLIPLPISLYDKESDERTIRRILTGCDDGLDGMQSLDSPAGIIERAGLCRVVVTGSYHSAVFALAQGIPVVALANSAYYMDKFLGLAEQFGCGCEVFFLDDEQVQERLGGGIEKAWRSAEQLRPRLLEAAARQVTLSREAYERFYQLVESKKAKAESRIREEQIRYDGKFQDATETTVSCDAECAGNHYPCFDSRADRCTDV